MENEPDKNPQLDSLEDPGTVVQTEKDLSAGAVTDATSADSTNADQPTSPPPGPKKRFSRRRLQDLLSQVNVYLLIFILVVVLAALGVFISFQRSRKESTSQLTTTPLTAETLDKLKESEAKVGDPKQVLSIESNTIFAGKVLLRDSLDVAGTIRVGGALSLPGITVSGSSSFDQIQANSLSIAGDTNIQGQMTIQRNLSVTGSGSFGGALSAQSLNVQNLQLSGDLQINRHIDAGGGTPSRTNGSALGNGGTTSVGGSDTAGTVTINTGGSPGAGCFLTVNFNRAFNATPHIVVTPVGSAAAGLNYYINRSTSNFSICSTNAAPGGTSFSFDYIALD